MTEACFAIIFDGKGNVVDAGPYDKGSSGIELNEESSDYIDLRNVHRITSTSIYITESPHPEKHRGHCCWVPGPFGWKCVPC